MPEIITGKKTTASMHVKFKCFVIDMFFLFYIFLFYISCYNKKPETPITSPITVIQIITEKNSNNQKSTAKEAEEAVSIVDVDESDFIDEKIYSPGNMDYKQVQPISDFLQDYPASEVISERASKTVKVREDYYKGYKVYNSQGQLEKVIDFDEDNGGVLSTRTFLFYDEKNNIVRIEGKNSENELSPFCMDDYCIITIKYDDRNRITEEAAFVDESTTSSANGTGYMHKVRYIYNDQDNFVETVIIFAPDNGVVNEIEYDKAGNITSVKTEVPVAPYWWE